MNEYEVGQILFLANESSFKIIPVQVIEEVIRTTIEGQSKTYLVKFPNKDRSVVDINDLKYKHFKRRLMIWLNLQILLKKKCLVT